MRRFANAFRSADMRGIVPPPLEGNEDERGRRFHDVMTREKDGDEEG
jgi:hypothetical protein